MVLIAIDKLNRRVLGYLCENNNGLAYCCSECDIEFVRSTELEEHMNEHKLKASQSQCEIVEKIGVDDDVPLQQRKMSRRREIVADKAVTENNKDVNIGRKRSRSVRSTRSSTASPAQLPVPSPSSSPPPTAPSTSPRPSALSKSPEPSTSPGPSAPSKSPGPSTSPPPSALPPSAPSTSPPPSTSPTPPPQPPQQPLSSVVSDDVEKTPQPTVNGLDSIPVASIDMPPISRCFVSLNRCDDLIEKYTKPTPPSNATATTTENGSENSPSTDADDSDESDSFDSPIVPPKRFNCVHCSAVFNTVRRLKWHVDSAHASFVCFLCGRKFKTNGLLVAHQKTHQTGVQAPVFPCRVCGQSVSNLKKHMDEHRKVHEMKETLKTKVDAITGKTKRPDVKRPCNTKSSVEVDVQQLADPLADCDKERLDGMAVDPSTDDEVKILDDKMIDPLATVADNTLTDAASIEAPNSSVVSSSSTPAVTSTTHIVLSSPAKQRGYICPTCGVALYNKVRFAHHVKMHDSNRRPCQLCGKLLKIKYAPVHMKKFHSGATGNKVTPIESGHENGLNSPSLDPIMDNLNAANMMAKDVMATDSLATEIMASEMEDPLAFAQNIEESNNISEYHTQAVYNNEMQMHESMDLDTDSTMMALMDTNESILSTIDEQGSTSFSMDSSHSMRLAMESSLMFL